MTHFLRLPAHDYNTGVALNHHTHYDHSGHSGGGVVKEATIPSLCDAPGVLQRAQVVMRPGIEGLALQLQHLGFQLPPEWWWPLRCNQSAQVVQQTNLAVMLTGLIRSFVMPKAWNTIGHGVYIRSALLPTALRSCFSAQATDLDHSSGPVRWMGCQSCCCCK